MSKQTKQVMVSHGKVTHKFGAPCESCEENEGEWKAVKELIDTQVNQAYKRVLELIGELEGTHYDGRGFKSSYNETVRNQLRVELKTEINKLIKKET